MEIGIHMAHRTSHQGSSTRNSARQSMYMMGTHGRRSHSAPRSATLTAARSPTMSSMRLSEIRRPPCRVRPRGSCSSNEDDGRTAPSSDVCHLQRTWLLKSPSMQRVGQGTRHMCGQEALPPPAVPGMLRPCVRLQAHTGVLPTFIPSAARWLSLRVPPTPGSRRSAASPPRWFGPVKRPQ